MAPFLKVLGQERICVVERLMVDETHRGSSATLRMYKEVMCFVLEKHIEAIFLDCEPHHLNSYLKLGFRPFAETYSYPGIGLVIPMVLICGDYQHLKQAGSPFSVLVNEKDLAYCQFADQLRELVSHRGKVVSQAASEPEDFLHSIYGICQDRCRLFDHAARHFSSLLRSGFNATDPTGSQFRVWPDHRAGLAAFACS